MKVTWAPSALREFDTALAYIELRSVKGAERVGAAILHAVDLIAEFPNIAPQSRYRGLRQKTVARTPYVIVYQVMTERVEIRAVIHARRRRRR